MVSPEQEEIRSAMVEYQACRLEAFDRLYVLLSPRLRRFLVSLSRDAPRSEDLLQETFLQIHRARRSYDCQRPVEPWAFAIAKHVFLMDRRAQARRGGARVSLLEPRDEPAVRSHDEPLVARDQVERGLAGLTPGRRSAVLLHHLWGWSFSEIGSRLGVSGRVAKLRSSRGMASLRAFFRKDLSTDGQ